MPVSTIRKTKNTKNPGLKEEDAYPADPEDDMVGKSYLVREW